MADVPHTRSLQDVRQESAFSMESFIKHHMMVILQPFIDHVQALDSRLNQVSEQLGQTDSSLEDTQSMLETTKAALADLRDGVIGRTNTRVQKLNDAIDRCVVNHELLHQNHEGTRDHVQKLQDQLQVTAGTQPELQRGLLHLEGELQVLRANLERTNDDVDNSVKRSLDQLGSDVQGLKAWEGRSSADLQQLKADLAQKSQLLQETREVLDKTVAGANGLQRHFQDMMQREAQMGARVEGWKHQWNKINPALDALRKDTAFLKQRSEHHDVVVHGLQQGYATTFSSVEALDGKHHGLRNEVQALQESLGAAHKALEDTRDGLGKATSFSNNLHTVLERTAGDLNKTAQKLEGLENRHDVLTDHVEKTTSNLTELARDHRANAAQVDALQQDLHRANEHLSLTRNQLEATNSGLSSVRGELGRTNEAVHRLDHGVELCHAGFSGLQKGFAETGTHMSSRPITLPKLPPSGSSLRSPRHHDTSMGSTFGGSTTATSAWRSP